MIGIVKGRMPVDLTIFAKLRSNCLRRRRVSVIEAAAPITILRRIVHNHGHGEARHASGTFIQTAQNPPANGQPSRPRRRSRRFPRLPAEAVIEAAEALAADPAPPEIRPPVPDPADAVMALTAPPPTPPNDPAEPPADPAPEPPVSQSSQLASPPQPPMLFEDRLGSLLATRRHLHRSRTKAAQMVERWGDRYCLIGPYNPADRRRGI